ncbi:MAG: beta-galactosidase [Clostridia bacterium]|nr:beta-galactosidase [Clostridia bacterium]
MKIMRCEHPRPDALRVAWINLNGEWDFEIDNALVGIDSHYEKRDSFSGKINVPFCPESKLSGVGNTDFMNGVWYRRNIDIPTEWCGKRVLLHFEASDYETAVFVNGKTVGIHRGGYTPFCFDITDKLENSGNYVTVFAKDDVRSPEQVSGKQSEKLGSFGCFYTRTTGIWQTVWLEAVDACYIERYEAVADTENTAVTFSLETSEMAYGADAEAKVYFDGRLVGEAKTKIFDRAVKFTVSLSEKHLWDIGEGNLYDVVFELSMGGEKKDTLKGYFGLRDVRLTKEGFYLNGRRIYGRFVLDQGFYPDGIYTAPSDEALVFDIEASMKLGFNGARLHQKVFEARFLYHADRLGYMVWDETGNWGWDHTQNTNIYNFLPEWIEEMKRDMSHPSLIGWCPFNETWDKEDGRRQSNQMLDLVFDVTRAIDPTRPIVGNSGSYPCKSDVHDVHDYEQDPEKFGEYYSHIKEGVVKCQLYRVNPRRQVFDTSKNVFVSEYGGIKWVVGEDASAWGYGDSVKSEEEFIARLKGLTDVLLDSEDIFAYCYTQLTDVEQEQNGLLTYDRKFKFPPEVIYDIMARKAACEE